MAVLQQSWRLLARGPALIRLCCFAGTALCAGTQPGTTLVMSKRGVPKLGTTNARGDHLVHVKVSPGAQLWSCAGQPSRAGSGCLTKRALRLQSLVLKAKLRVPPFAPPSSPPPSAGQDPQDHRRRGAQAHGAAAGAAGVQAGGRGRPRLVLGRSSSGGRRLRDPPAPAGVSFLLFLVPLSLIVF